MTRNVVQNTRPSFYFTRGRCGLQIVKSLHIDLRLILALLEATALSLSNCHLGTQTSKRRYGRIEGKPSESSKITRTWIHIELYHSVTIATAKQCNDWSPDPSLLYELWTDAISYQCPDGAIFWILLAVVISQRQTVVNVYSFHYKEHVERLLSCSVFCSCSQVPCNRFAVSKPEHWPHPFMYQLP